MGGGGEGVFIFIFNFLVKLFQSSDLDIYIIKSYLKMTKKTLKSDIHIFLIMNS